MLQMIVLDGFLGFAAVAILQADACLQHLS
jgi:hypothetical protein